MHNAKVDFNEFGPSLCLEAFVFGLIRELCGKPVPLFSRREDSCLPDAGEFSKSSWSWFRFDEFAFGMSGLRGVVRSDGADHFSIARRMQQLFARGGRRLYLVGGPEGANALSALSFHMPDSGRRAESLTLVCDPGTFSRALPESLLPMDAYLETLTDLLAGGLSFRIEVSPAHCLLDDRGVQFDRRGMRGSLLDADGEEISVKIHTTGGAMTVTVQSGADRIDMNREVSLRVVIGNIRLPLRRLLTLRPGSELEFTIPDPCEVVIEHAGCRFAVGRLRFQGDSVDVEITGIELAKKLAEAVNASSSATII